MLKRVVEVIASGTVKSLKGTFDSVCGKHNGDKDKKWVVDFDWADTEDSSGRAIDVYRKQKVKEMVLELQGETKKDPLLIELPTKNGLHFITRPFNLKKFKDKFPGIDVHKDNPTILYCP